MKKGISQFRGFGRVFRKLGKNPSFDWYFSLACFAVSLVIVLAIDGFIYFEFALKEAPQSDVVARRVIFNRKSVTDVLSSVAQEKMSADAIPPSVLIDPSK